MKKIKKILLATLLPTILYIAWHFHFLSTALFFLVVGGFTFHYLDIREKSGRRPGNEDNKI
jgi:hypothetical protein